MRAIIQEKYGGPEALRLKDVAQPSPRKNEVLVKILAASINDYDWCLMRGKPFLYRLMFGLLKPKQKIPGMELSGVIEGLGEGVQEFNVGNAVYGDISEHGFGGFAEYVCVNEKALSLKPEFMSFTDAASIPHAALLAKQGLIDVGNIQPGNKVLINGAGGGVGTFALYIAKQYGVEVTGVDTGHKLSHMLSIGYDHVIDYTRSDFTQNGLQYDLILDAKTNRRPTDYMRSLVPGGQYVTVGGNLGRLLQMVVLKRWVRRIHKKAIDIVSLKSNKDLAYIEQLYEAGKITPIIDGPHKLSDVPKLIAYFGQGKHTGKVVVAPWDK
ncbi:MAG: NAD(P)-dependent alcohol dehydrogenase [Gammaproteobacteria bacterium]|nr:NAD(P)-dependent alcohol dehydrogenase [Gammaproteobacteria bacterium]